MALYSLAQRTTGTLSGAAAWEIRAAAGVKPKILELGVSANTTAGNQFGIGRPAAIGITPTTPQVFLEEQGDGPAGTTQGAVAWGTGPTVPTNFFRRLSHSGTINSGTIYMFPRGLAITSGGSIVLWNTANNGVVDCWAVVDE